jgi:membrane glycosyltransferase
MSPTIIGLVLAIPLSWLSGQLGVGLALKRMGLLMTPEEARPPPIATRANALQAELTKMGYDDADGIATLYADPALRQRHEAMLPALPPRKRGIIDTDRALAEAKIMDAETIQDALQWLQLKERFVVLHDRALLDLIARLRPEAEAAPRQEAAE